MAGGIKYSAAAPLLAGVTDNGIDPADPRVMVRTNEATKIVLDTLVPVGGMITADLMATGTILLLPKEFENAIEVEVLNDASVRGRTDVTQGWYEIINQFTYVDPTMVQDNPLVDLGLVPDTDPTILRRKYDYPGLSPNATVRVTGAKRYVPITDEDDYLIVQNIEALKLIILSIERYENNDPDGAQKYRQQGFELLQAEVKKHILDPTNSIKRRSAYEDDLTNFSMGSMAWVRARLALEIEGALRMGKSQLTRLLEMSERRLMEKGTWKGTIKFYEADVSCGIVYFPKDVEAILAADLCCGPIPIHNSFYEHSRNGPGMSCHGAGMLIDQGDEYFPTSGNTRRKYKLSAGENAESISVVAKIRWIPKNPEDQMTIKNFEALRLMVTAIIMERAEKWKEAGINQQMAEKILDDELREHLSGQVVTAPTNFGVFGRNRRRGLL